MDKELFGQLVQSLTQAQQIAQGKVQASRRFKVSPTDVKKVREQAGLSQSELAGLMRVSIKTLQNWEQKRRSPTGPASALLQVFMNAPAVATQALQRT